MLKIGVIGYSPKVVINNILPFLRKLEEDIDTANLDVASMYPKTTMMTKHGILISGNAEYIFLTQDMNKYAGITLDQLIICDDNNWMVYIEQADRILRAKYMLRHSCVPDEFQVIELEYPIGGINYGVESREEKLDKFLDHVANVSHIPQGQLKAIKQNILKGDRIYITMPRHNGRTALKNHWDRIKGEFR